MVTKVELGIEDEETGWEGEIACANEAREEVVRLCVDGERLGLKYDLEYTIEDREGEVDDGDSRCGDPFPLRKKALEMANRMTLLVISGDMPGHERDTRDTRRARTKSFNFAGSTVLKCITKRLPGT